MRFALKEKTMTRSRSSMLTLLAAIAALQAHAAAVAGAADAASGIGMPNGEALTETSTLMTAAIDTGNLTWQVVSQWLVESYERAPALMLGLSVLLAVPPLALAGLLVRRSRPPSDATRLISRPNRGASNKPPITTVRTEVSAWPTQAWVEVESMPGERFVIERTLIRIGREEDNDIRFPAATVHRYHAVIRRTTEGDVVITDLSGEDGNGVLVNGERVLEAKLKKGDRIDVGEVKLRFDARPV